MRASSSFSNSDLSFMQVSCSCLKENYADNRMRESSLLCHLRSSSSSKPGGRSEPAKQLLKKPKLPVGRFDETEESSIEKEPLEKYILPYHVNRKPGLKALTSWGKEIQTDL
ncbi:PREDICTED: succinate dehydrogenase assembly factor 4, mitochondrial isoform X3 [Corvus brachyrhynchos]|uniref:succinate dehydrogenase assembly factor 4, mitochondrial isoform X3 n=1 Tax=Corvus brachyrhynchos TaxID=85066 RepID=UPI000816741C|nr:PREDICTED: succinate dehydrogenase assembly factor 4, mitochondrial isoform X3 [Corvus brachyrhynchos]